MIILGLDFETTGQSPETNSVAEVGAVLWSTELRRPVRSMSYYVYNRHAIWEPGTSEFNGITPEHCAEYGVDDEPALKRLIAYYLCANVICTHNGTNFDRIFYELWCQRLGYLEQKDQGKTWIDTKIDLPFPSRRWQYLDLVSLAAHHGILHRHAHGALPDANIMLEIMDQYNFGQVMASAASPNVVVQALIPKQDKDLASARGYKWRPGPKQWVKTMKAHSVEDEAAVCGFPVKIIKN